MQLTKSPEEGVSTENYSLYSIIRDQPADYSKENPKTKRDRVNLLRRVPLGRLMDLKVDYAFKQLFGNEQNKQITVVFLNAILQKSGRDPIKNIAFINIEAGGEHVSDKQSRLDLLVVTETEEKINVEIQFTDQYDMVKRSLYYWSGVYRSQIQRGMAYKELAL